MPWLRWMRKSRGNSATRSFGGGAARREHPINVS
jgi:hypothetical protein